MATRFIAVEHTDWSRLRADFSLEAPNAAKEAQSLPGDPGLYLWTMCTGKQELVLYVGRASSLSRRIYNYTQPFQPHSPNDRKLYFAQTSLKQQFPDAMFSLYWKPIPLDALNKSEKTAIAEFRPLLNMRSAYSTDHAANLESAYQKLYKEVLARHLGDA